MLTKSQHPRYDFYLMPTALCECADNVTVTNLESAICELSSILTESPAFTFALIALANRKCRLINIALSSGQPKRARMTLNSKLWRR